MGKKYEQKTYDSDALRLDKFNFGIVDFSTGIGISHLEISIGRHDLFCVFYDVQKCCDIASQAEEV